METYLFSNFPNGLINHHLLKEINDNNNINKICTNIATEGDNVYIYFSDNLEVSEKAELNNIINNYVYDYDGDIYINATLTKTFQAGQVEQYENWTVTAGKLNGFNANTGIFTIPYDGVYTFGLSLLFSSPNNTYAVTRLYDPSNNYTWLISTDEIKSISGESGFIVGLSNYLKQGLQFKLESLFDNLESNVTIKLRIIKL